jgi:hypothetical protein
MRGFRFEKYEAAATALVFTVFPFYFIFVPNHTPLAREEERLAHIAELACGRSGAEEGARGTIK